MARARQPHFLLAFTILTITAGGVMAQQILHQDQTNAVDQITRHPQPLYFQTGTKPAPTGQGKAAENAGDQNPYWPLKQGNTWHYVISVGSDEAHLKDNAEAIQAVTKITSTPGKGSLVFLTLTLKGRVMGADQYLLNAGQISEAAISMGIEKLTPNRPFLKASLKAGMQWDWKGSDEAAGEKTQETCHFVVVGPEQIKVPAGTFQTLHLKQTLAGDANEGTREFWFAKNVGIVQTRKYLGEFVTYSKLTEYKLTP